MTDEEHAAETTQPADSESMPPWINRWLSTILCLTLLSLLVHAIVTSILKWHLPDGVQGALNIAGFALVFSALVPLFGGLLWRTRGLAQRATRHDWLAIIGWWIMAVGFPFSLLGFELAYAFPDLAPPVVTLVILCGGFLVVIVGLCLTFVAIVMEIVYKIHQRRARRNA